MAKFVIQCPVCGKYAEAKTGFFAKKKIDCATGDNEYGQRDVSGWTDIRIPEYIER